MGTGYNGSVLLARGKTRHGKFAVKAFKLHGVSKEKKQDRRSGASEEALDALTTDMKRHGVVTSESVQMASEKRDELEEGAFEHL